MAGVGVRLHQLVLPVQCLLGQILLQDGNIKVLGQSAAAGEAPASWLPRGAHHIRVFHPVDAVPVPQIGFPLLVIVTCIG